MYKRQIICVLLLFVFVPQPGWSRRHRGSSGYAPVKNHGQFSQRSASWISESKRNDAIRTQAIDKYMKLGCQLESEQKWKDSEASFRYVLRVVALRDGPGSPAGLPALKHLVTVSKAQNKLSEATGFEETASLMKKMHPELIPPQKTANLNQVTKGKSM